MPAFASRLPRFEREDPLEVGSRLLQPRRDGEREHEPAREVRVRAVRVELDRALEVGEACRGLVAELGQPPAPDEAGVVVGVERQRGREVLARPSDRLEPAAQLAARGQRLDRVGGEPQRLVDVAARRLEVAARPLGVRSPQQVGDLRPQTGAAAAAVPPPPGRGRRSR